jgi:chain length determinant protein tyrosine kinase EpsG
VSADDLTPPTEQDRPIGEIIRETKQLDDAQLDDIIEYQRTHDVRFGEAAVALGYASEADVVYALSQQFRYPFLSDERRPLNAELVTATQPFSRQAEAFRAIRSQLMMRCFNPAEPKRALAIVSPDSGDGKTFFTANIGVVLSQLGGRTLVIDADLRGPRMHDVFGIPNHSGLSAVLSGRQEESVIFQAPDLPSLFVMPVGVMPPNPLELVERPAFRLLLAEVLRKFDHVVVDTPAACFGTDAAVVAARCGAALLLGRKDRSRMGSLDMLAAHMASANTLVAGVIVNRF